MVVAIPIGGVMGRTQQQQNQPVPVQTIAKQPTREMCMEATINPDGTQTCYRGDDTISMTAPFYSTGKDSYDMGKPCSVQKGERVRVHIFLESGGALWISEKGCSVRF